jgi:maleate isomerase
MTDSLGYRMKFGVIAPSTNTSVQPEFDAMRPVGVTNHFSRIVIPDNPVNSDEDFNALMDDIRETMMDSVDSVMSASPDYLVMGMPKGCDGIGCLSGSFEVLWRYQANCGDHTLHAGW